MSNYVDDDFADIADIIDQEIRDFHYDENDVIDDDNLDSVRDEKGTVPEFHDYENTPQPEVILDF